MLPRIVGRSGANDTSRPSSSEAEKHEQGRHSDQPSRWAFGSEYPVEYRALVPSGKVFKRA